MGKQESKPKGKTKRASEAPSDSTQPSGDKPGKPGDGGAAGKGAKAGSRGAAPWAARHAAKHAAEARARNLEPPRPGSARATLRVPDEAERIKARIGELHNAVIKVRGLRKNLAGNFYEIGQILQHIQEATLYDAKGYSSFEAFAERELDLGKSLSTKLLRIPSVFQRQAIELGLDALVAALTAIDEAAAAGAGQAPPQKPGSGRAALPMKPPRAARN